MKTGKKLYWLVALREQNDMTQEQLAERSGLSRATVNYVEAGRRKPAELAARKIAEALSFDWHRFYDNSNGMEVKTQ